MTNIIEIDIHKFEKEKLERLIELLVEENTKLKQQLAAKQQESE
jgi:hypothetical protein